MELDLVAGAYAIRVRDVVGEPDPGTVGARHDVHVVEHIGAGEEHTVQGSGLGSRPAGSRDGDRIAHRLLDHGADERTRAHHLREELPAPVDQEALAVRARLRRDARW